MRADVLRHGDGHDGSRVGYVELFFDLVFVFAVTQLSHSLIAHPDLTTLLHTLVLGWAVWWLWIDTTWVTNWLDPDKVPVRTMLLVLMLLGLLMSSAIPEAFEGKALLFAVPFVHPGGPHALHGVGDGPALARERRRTSCGSRCG